MTDFEARLRGELERAYPAEELDIDAGWHEALARASEVRSPTRSPTPTRSRSPWRARTRSRGEAARPAVAFNRTSLALALALVLLLCGAALAASNGLLNGPLGGFSHWLRAGPGSAAPPRAQRAFSQDNAASVAHFPKATTLRLLMHGAIAGERYELFGFRAEGSLCLELHLGRSAPAPACAPISGLTSGRQPAHLLAAGAPAHLLAAGAPALGKTRPAATVSYGLATDSVAAVDVVDGAGRHAATLKDNAFLFVSRSAQKPLGAIAIDASGDEVPIAIAQASAGEQPPAITGPAGRESQLSFGRPPERVAETAGPHGSLSWLIRRRALGEPLRREQVAPLLPEGARLLFARKLSPDAHDALRVGVALMTYAGKREVCEILYAPLASKLVGCEAASSLFAKHYVLGRMIAIPEGSQRYVLVGLASPQVTKLAYIHAGMDMFDYTPLSHGVFAITLPVSSSSLWLQADGTRITRGGATLLEDLESAHWRASP